MENNQIQSTSELAIRREKLANLVAQGKNPFEITKYDVTHTAPSAIREFEEKESTFAEGESITVRVLISSNCKQNMNVHSDGKQDIINTNANQNKEGKILYVCKPANNCIQTGRRSAAVSCLS